MVIGDEADNEAGEGGGAFTAYSHGITSTEGKILETLVSQSRLLNSNTSPSNCLAPVVTAAALLEKHGRNELPEKIIPKWYIFVQQLWQPMPIMIWIALIVEAGIENFIDMAILIFIQFANATIGFYEVRQFSIRQIVNKNLVHKLCSYRLSCDETAA